MSEKRPYQIPDYIVQNLNDGQAFSDKDAQEIDNILSTAGHFPYPHAETEGNWLSLRAKLDTPLTVTKKPAARQFAMFKWAAAAVIVLTIGVGVWQFQKNKSDNFTAIYKTEKNRELIKLPDGTTINLNTFTEVEVKTMNSTERVVSLKAGEAFFHVIHNQLPFKVETDRGAVMVTGTEFNIKSRKGLPFVVFLKTGKVRFQTDKGVLDMHPGESLKEAGSDDWMISRSNDGSQSSWISGKLVFKSQPLSEIVKELEATYKVKFVYDSKLSSEKYNFVCDNNLNATQVADLLTKVVSSKVSIE